MDMVNQCRQCTAGLHVGFAGFNIQTDGFLVNWQASIKTDDNQLSTGIVEPGAHPRTSPTLTNTESDWLCAWCLNRVANERDRFEYEGKNEFGFANPEGLRFEIITFSRTLGCLQAGVPTLEHTWFSAHAWSFCHCDHCGQHLGWYYTGQHDFAGLIKDRIVLAVCVRN
jgi:hypothetical protein